MMTWNTYPITSQKIARIRTRKTESLIVASSTSCLNAWAALAKRHIIYPKGCSLALQTSKVTRARLAVT